MTGGGEPGEMWWEVGPEGSLDLLHERTYLMLE